ncbi:hypothetical protein [Serratia sp. M24T3]|uniref:hypothetical protein n=1 Tax=Serratia sp. M24T3 TaxID=932213 RepID=UPI00056AEAC7|nr:hypothetical protein [Serratia sp. M24T3]
MMNFTDSITLHIIHEDTEFTPAKSEILFEATPTGTFIEGKILEKAVALDNGYLLFITDDIPEEEFLTVLLCNKKFELLDKALIGSAMSTGDLRDVQLHGDEVHFRFIGDTVWRLRPLAHPALRLPLLSDPRGVSRPLGLRQHFTLHAEPKRASQR